MKIGILSFHRAFNYGAQLQAYALSRTLREMGHDVEFVDYRQPMVENYFKIFNLNIYKDSNIQNKLKIFLFRLYTLKRRISRFKNFKRFSNKWINKSSQFEEGKKFNDQYDVLIFGSDQIWTVRFLHNFDPILWGAINIITNKKIAYAPSMELKFLDNDQLQFCKSHLSNFDALSVREESMKTLLSPLTDKNISVVLDPVFLRPFEEYQSLSEKSKLKLPSQYLLIYTIGKPSPYVLKIANYIAKEKDIPIIKIAGDVFLHSSKEDIPTAGPYEFLEAFNKADFIITTTFHGTAFSVLCQKDFYSIKNEGISGRAEALLTKIGLANRLISSPDSVDLKDKIDFSVANRKLDQLKKESLDYLKRELNR